MTQYSEEADPVSKKVTILRGYNCFNKSSIYMEYSGDEQTLQWRISTIDDSKHADVV